MTWPSPCCEVPQVILTVKIYSVFAYQKLSLENFNIYAIWPQRSPRACKHVLPSLSRPFLPCHEVYVCHLLAPLASNMHMLALADLSDTCNNCYLALISVSSTSAVFKQKNSQNLHIFSARSVAKGSVYAHALLEGKLLCHVQAINIGLPCLG